MYFGNLNQLSRGKKINGCPEFETLSSLVQYNAKSGFSPPDKGDSRWSVCKLAFASRRLKAFLRQAVEFSSQRNPPLTPPLSILWQNFLSCPNEECLRFLFCLCRPKKFKWCSTIVSKLPTFSKSWFEIINNAMQWVLRLSPKTGIILTSWVQGLTNCYVVLPR